MSVLNQSGEEQVECPLCMEPLEVDDLHFYPCTCGYQICRFCWNRIREGENGLCPACRKAYPENPADFTPLSQEQVAAIKTEKKAREAKRRNKTLESRRALANVRVVQNNLVFVVGLPVRLADPEILKRQEYFGKYGKIHKVVINQSPAYAGSQQVPSASAYVTYVSPADALRAIQGVNNATLDGRVLKGSLGTTKYCANFMKNQPCPKSDCMYLHELGDPKASFTKEEMHAGLHQVYERKLHQLLAQARQDEPPAKATGNSSTNAEKGNSKDGNNSNFIPTTVVTSSHINVVSTSKSKKDSVNGSISNSNGNGNGSNSDGNGSVSDGSSGKEAWPSLSTSPPSDSPARKQSSPKPHQTTVKSQENGTSESSSPTQLQTRQSQTKNSKENHTESKSNRNSKDSSSTGSQHSKKNKESKKQKNSNSTTSTETSESETLDTKQIEANTQSTHTSSVFESDTQQSYLSNELDELESDRHSLLENHDLLDNSDHSLLEDDNTHNLLNDANNEVLMMQRHREMLAGLVDNNHLLPHNMKSPLVNGYSLLDREASMYLSNDSQISQGMLENDMLLRERNRSSMLLRQNEMLRQQHAMVEPKHYMTTNSIGLNSGSELLGANYHQNPNMLPPFGMRVDNSLSNTMPTNSLVNSLSASSIGSSAMATNSLGGNTMATNSLGGNTMATNSLGGNMMATNSLGGNTMAANSLSTNSMVNSLTANSMGVNSLTANSMGGAYMMQHQQLLQQSQQQMANATMAQNALVNGFDAQQSNSEGRYLAENMDKFFTDFHKAQQMRLLVARDERRYDHQQQMHYPHKMLSAERLEMEHKQRMNSMRAGSENSGRAAGDGDDDLDFDPFKETQKALAEMMESEMMHNNISSGDNLERVRRARLAPPGFGHMNAFGAAAPRHHPHHPHHQAYNNTNSAMFSDWTQMDPAIMSTSVSRDLAKGAPPAPAPAPAQPSLSQQQQELFARFNHLNVHQNGLTKIQVPCMNVNQQWANQKMQWGGAPPAYNNIPLPPGFAPAKPAQRPAECIDAK